MCTAQPWQQQGVGYKACMGTQVGQGVYRAAMPAAWCGLWACRQVQAGAAAIPSALTCIATAALLNSGAMASRDSSRRSRMWPYAHRSAPACKERGEGLRPGVDARVGVAGRWCGREEALYIDAKTWR